jgi:transcription elongation factor GreA
VTQSNEDAIWMAPEALEAVKAEKEDLAGPQRTAIIERIAAAREEGDLKENGGYHAAKDEQGKVEAKIRQLDELIRVADTSVVPDDGIVSPGKLVTTDPRFTEDDKQEPFLLAMRVHEEAYPDDLDVFSPQSPLGSSIVGAKQGEVVDYKAPNGRDIKITIVEVRPYGA